MIVMKFSINSSGGKKFMMNMLECGKCGYFDGLICRKNCEERDEYEVVEDCKHFEYSIYYM